MTKLFTTLFGAAAFAALAALPADAACTITSSKSNSSFKVWQDETGKTCTPTAAERAAANAQPGGTAQPNKPKGGTNTIGSATSGAGSGK